MGSQLVKFPLTAGGSILVEVDDPQIGNRQVSRDMAVRSVDNFDSVVAQVKPGVEILIAQLRDLTSRPDQVSLEFGIKLTAGGDAGLFNANAHVIGVGTASAKKTLPLEGFV